tara:strand:+ start:3379 stop:3738 length:360 start_codon:yes stop_codon:yes gene_type:complete
MKWAIILYAIMGYENSLTDTELLISWNLTFDTQPQCESFYRGNEVNLHSGVLDYSKQKYKSKMHVIELGCVHATSQSPSDMKPELKDFNPLYKKSISPNDGQKWRERKHYDDKLLLRRN